MLTITSKKNAADAKRYIANQEKVEGCEAVPPRWFGLGALRLGLEGLADRLIFNRLIDGKTADGKGKLTPRMKKNRISLWDLVLSPPKGVSLVAEFSPAGEQVREITDAVAWETFQNAVEPFAMTRVRKGGKDENRPTGELLGMLQVHFVSRANQPQWHAHLGLANATHDPQEGWKALNPREIYVNAPAAQKYFHRRLREEVEKLGFPTVKKGKFWDISLPRATIAKFSKRRAAILNLYGKRKSVSPKLRRKAALMTRDAKPEVIDLGALRKQWVEMLTPREVRVFQTIQAQPKIGRDPSLHRASLLSQLTNQRGISRGERGLER